MVYEIKTKKNNANVKDFIDNIPDENKKADCKKLLEMLGKLTKTKPFMYGTSIVGFWNYSYENKNCKGEWFAVGFSPRKNYISLYFMIQDEETQKNLMKNIGKAKIGKCCVNFKKLADLDTNVIEKLVDKSIETTKKWRKENTI